jgi:hypothetical protein
VSSNHNERWRVREDAARAEPEPRATAGKSGLDPKRLADDDEAVLKDLVERHFRHWDGRMVISGQL